MLTPALDAVGRGSNPLRLHRGCCYLSGVTKKKQKPGPEPGILKLEGDWQERLSKAIRKKKPEGGWPKPERKKRQNES